MSSWRDLHAVPFAGTTVDHNQPMPGLRRQTQALDLLLKISRISLLAPGRKEKERRANKHSSISDDCLSNLHFPYYMLLSEVLLVEVAC
jgi:hypothetical protein